MSENRRKFVPVNMSIRQIGRKVGRVSGGPIMRLFKQLWEKWNRRQLHAARRAELRLSPGGQRFL